MSNTLLFSNSNWVTVLYEGVWIALLSGTVMAAAATSQVSSLLVHLRRHEELMPKSTMPIEIGEPLVFSGSFVGSSGRMISERAAVGWPTTFVFVGRAVLCNHERFPTLCGTITALCRRAFGRLWVLCEGEERECLELEQALKPQNDLRLLTLTALKQSEYFFNSNGDVTIITTDSDGYVLMYGRISQQEESYERSTELSDR